MGSALSEHPFLIIAGQPKAGTTSIHNWLAHHPDVCESSVKETRFFLDETYPVPSGKRFDGLNGHEYLSFFPERDGLKTLLESTPDYLYAQSALAISNLAPKARVVFVVRDPVERAVSWYKYAAQTGRLGKHISFDDYIRRQLYKKVTDQTPIHYRALDQNRIRRYLPAFQKRFGSRCLVLDFGDMKKDPYRFVSQICEFAGLDSRFYEGFDFRPKNVSTGRRASRSSRIYYRSRALFSYYVRPSENVRRYLRPLARLIKSVLSRSSFLGEIEVTEELAAAIRDDARSGCVVSNEGKRPAGRRK